MSVGNGPAGYGEPDAGSGKVGTAKQEAAAVKDTATDAAKNVAHTAKDEAASVAGEAKSQLKDLYAQSRTELGDQAATQQARLATGLKSMGDELGSMARNSEGGGVATDIVQQIATRVSDAASWLDTRDPASVLDEVKRFARKRPLVFIAGAAIAGLVAGRLVRAVASNQHDAGQDSTGVSATPAVPAIAPASSPAGTATAGTATGVGAATTAPADPLGGGPANTASAPAALDAEETPLYSESAASFDQARQEAPNERNDTF
ncbi:MAG TPA: hypothetical protein DHW40_06775 [Microbacterium sp.]|nr:hypothetical protein [Microbacterium sp.]